MQAESCMVGKGMAMKCRMEWEWLSCSNKEERVAVVAVHKVKEGVAVDGGRYWRCGDPQQRVWEQHIGQYEDENNI